ANDKDLVEFLVSIIDSPYAHYLTKQFIPAAVTKISSWHTTTYIEQDRIQELLAKYTTSPELELQQRAVKFASLFDLGELREGVLKCIPPPELKATVISVLRSCRVWSFTLFCGNRNRNQSLQMPQMYQLQPQPVGTGL
ncbi:hypothetical protein DXG01_012875, partial [Tephrocybe rancida]